MPISTLDWFSPLAFMGSQPFLQDSLADGPLPKTVCERYSRCVVDVDKVYWTNKIFSHGTIWGAPTPTKNIPAQRNNFFLCTMPISAKT